MTEENRPFCTYEITKEPDNRDLRAYKFCFEEMKLDKDGDWCCSIHGKAKLKDACIA